MLENIRKFDRLNLLTGLIGVMALCETFQEYEKYTYFGKSFGGSVFSALNALVVAGLIIYCLRGKNKFGYGIALAYSVIQLVATVLVSTTFYLGYNPNRPIHYEDILIFILSIPAIVISYKFLRFFLAQAKIMRAVSDIDLAKDYDAAFRFRALNQDMEDPEVRDAQSHVAWDLYEMHRRNRNVLPLIKELETADEASRGNVIERLAMALGKK